ncbi:MAG TPA: helical backbone metal receptor [Candidatus Binatia bacterium]|nr:helical backbone metal receptor [Candidatus Binatia bacterium]
MRVVSLVPSLTEALIDFGLGASIVGRTRYCEEPADVVAGIETVGGTKNPDVERIIALRPDLVIVNKEENRIEDCQALEAAGIALHVTHPRTVQEAASMIQELGAACGAGERSTALAEDIRASLAAHAADAGGREAVRTFCPIWRKPYMTFRRATYIGDMLAHAGCDNIFGDAADTDFFEVSVEQILQAKPALVVLPDEPYVFEPRHAEELREAGVNAQFLHLDGKDLAWYGPRIPHALRRLSEAVTSVAARR